MVIVVMGVSGAGKTTIGKMLAEQLGWEFHDADDLHSEANKAKMASGIALTDADRAPWLASIRELIADRLARNINVVLACSALKQSYRDEIIVDPARVKIVYPEGQPGTDRIENCASHQSLHEQGPPRQPVRYAGGASRCDRGRYRAAARNHRGKHPQATRAMSMRRNAIAVIAAMLALLSLNLRSARGVDTVTIERKPSAGCR